MKRSDQSRSLGAMMQSVVVFALLFSYAASSIIVATSEGCLRGKSHRTLEKDVQVFLGIPYAKPPEGELRFQKPQPPSTWDDVYDATSAKDSCMQPRFPRLFDVPTPLSEDCLYLNVWTPLASERSELAVLVWLHGGVFKAGSAYEARYDGSALAALNDVVVVSCNYRLSTMGFLYANHTETHSNLAMWDQLLALQWVQRNIRAFGGDPGMVTIFGESAGAMMAHGHILSPHSRGLFRRVFLMSGTMSSDSCVDSVSETIAKANVVSTAVGCASKDLAADPLQVLGCLRNRPAEMLCTVKALTFRPTFETEFIPCLPSFASEEGYFNEVEAMVSVTAKEGPLIFLFQSNEKIIQDYLSSCDTEELRASIEGVFRAILKDGVFPLAMNYLKGAPLDDMIAQRERAAEFLGNYLFYCPTRRFAETYSTKGTKVYAMVFAHRSKKSRQPEWFGTTHMEELPFVFGIPFSDPTNYTDEDREFSAYVMKSLAEFARNGKPVLPDGKKWPQFSSKHPDFMWLQPGNYSWARNFSATACDVLRKPS
ncbi:cholinesterase-like isoform X1 [Amblyomma americanum]